MVLSALDCPRANRDSTKLDTNVRNGDCLPACFCAALEYLNQGKVSSTSLVDAAARLRTDLIEWIKENWQACPFWNQHMEVHEIVHLQHALGVTLAEMQKSVDWGDTPEERLEAYKACCDSLYFSDSEMMLFSSWLWEKRGVAFMFRVYRGVSTKHITDTPSPEMLRNMGVTHAVVVELDHSGDVDGRSAHYQLIQGASLSRLAIGFSPRVPTTPRKRKRPILLLAQRGR